MIKRDIEPINLKHVRLLIVLGMLIICAFIFTDLALLPEVLQPLYLESRLAMQVPICLFYLLLTFSPIYPQIHQVTMTTSLLLIMYVNFWVIYACWQFAQFAFPYEGTVIYSLFALFVFRIKLPYAIIFSAFTLLGFLAITLAFPIYGNENAINIGFVTCSLIVGLLGVYRIEQAQQQLSAANSQLLALSQTDHLTKILNRGAYEARFDEQMVLNKRSGNTVCVFFIDLDYFKDYNDNYGHMKGDDVIQLQAKMLSQIFRRATDIVARYGGEEFVVVTSDVNQAQCKQFAQEIIECWDEIKIPHGKGKGQDYVSCSVGFYIEKLTATSNKASLIQKADAALYQAKAKGRHTFYEYVE